MHEYLIDRETLGQFVDSLIAQKYPGRPADDLTSSETADLAKLRDDALNRLNARIGENLFGALSITAHDEIDSLLANPDTPPDEFRAFFEKYHIDVEEILKRTFADFQAEFMQEGGHNEQSK